MPERMTLENLHPDIINSEKMAGRKTVGVINPSRGLFGEKEEEDLVDIIYECNMDWCKIPRPHTHQALYGPKLIHFSDDCINCGQSKYRNCACYSPRGEEELDRRHYTLYAD